MYKLIKKFPCFKQTRYNKIVIYIKDYYFFFKKMNHLPQQENVFSMILDRVLLNDFQIRLH